MANFLLNYDDAKKLLDVFYKSPYGVVHPYVEILHGLKEDISALTLKEHLELEVEALNKANEVKVEPVAEATPTEE
jgi:hypothetical protein